jgi:hypothetical protein
MQFDDIPARIEAFDDANGGGVGYYKDKGAYTISTCWIRRCRLPG